MPGYGGAGSPGPALPVVGGSPPHEVLDGLQGALAGLPGPPPGGGAGAAAVGAMGAVFPVVPGDAPAEQLLHWLKDAGAGPEAVGFDAAVARRYLQKGGDRNPFRFEQCGGGCTRGCYASVWLHQPEWWSQVERRRAKLDEAYKNLEKHGARMAPVRHTDRSHGADASGRCQLSCFACPGRPAPRVASSAELLPMLHVPVADVDCPPLPLRLSHLILPQRF